MNATEKFNWKTASCIKRCSANPVLSAKDVPFHATLVFNAGVCKYHGKYVMVFRNDFGDAEKKELHGRNQGLATSDDGVHWTVAPEPLFHDRPEHYLYRLRDARLTVLDGKVWMTAWTDIGDGEATVTTTTEDFEKWKVMNICVPKNRNHVIFPERIDGKILRLERPFAGKGQRFHTWISASPDGRYWGDSELLLPNDDDHLPWVNDKMGPAGPPIRTTQGWLAMIHGVDRDDSRTGWGWSGNWTKRYSAGLMLLDKDDPSRLIGLSPGPVLVPEPAYSYETSGYRDFVIFPGATIPEPDGEIKIYYGASDTVQCLATAHIDDLLALIKPV